MAIEYTLRYKYNEIHHFPIFLEMVDFLFCIWVVFQKVCLEEILKKDQPKF